MTCGQISIQLPAPAPTASSGKNAKKRTRDEATQEADPSTTGCGEELRKLQRMYYCPQHSSEPGRWCYIKPSDPTAECYARPLYQYSDQARGTHGQRQEPQRGLQRWGSLDTGQKHSNKGTWGTPGDEVEEDKEYR